MFCKQINNIIFILKLQFRSRLRIFPRTFLYAPRAQVLLATPPEYDYYLHQFQKWFWAFFFFVSTSIVHRFWSKFKNFNSIQKSNYLLINLNSIQNPKVPRSPIARRVISSAGVTITAKRATTMTAKKVTTRICITFSIGNN